MTNGQHILQILGVATRARKTAIGYDTVINNIQNGKVKLVFIGSDASDKTKDKFIKKCYFYNIKVDMSFQSQELSKATGKGNAKVVAVCDQGFMENLSKLLKEGVNNESK